MELFQLLRHDLPVLLVGHAEPAVGGFQHGDLQLAGLHLAVHHHRQQTLRLDIVPGLVAQEVLKICPQRREDGGREAPEVHGHHGVRVQRPVLRQVLQRAVGVQLDLQGLPDSLELAVRHGTDAPGHRAVEAGGVLQKIPHHGGPARLGQLDKFIVNGLVGVDAVVVVGIDDATGLVDHVRRAQQGVDGAEGLGPLRRDGIKVRHGGKVLEGVGHLHGAAVPGGLLCQIISAQPVHHLLHLGLDDEHNLVEARAQGVVNGILHQNLVMGSDAVHLLTAAVAGAQARRHDDQRYFHVIFS